MKRLHPQQMSNVMGGNWSGSRIDWHYAVNGVVNAKFGPGGHLYYWTPGGFVPSNL